MSVNATGLAFDSNLPIDQTMFSFTFAIDIPNGGSSYSTLIELINSDHTGISTYALWLGRFSIDNVNWSPLDGLIQSGGDYVAASGYIQNGFFSFSAVNTTASSQLLYVEVTVIAAYNQAPFNPITNLSPPPKVIEGNATNTAWVMNPNYLLFDSRENYMKIAVQGSEAFTITENTINYLTIPHNLGYVPYSFVQMLVTPTTGNIDPAMTNLSSATEVVGLLLAPVFSYVYADTTNIYIASGLNASESFNVEIFYRTYLDVS